jgi:excisionase family DNA binding protein
MPDTPEPERRWLGRVAAAAYLDCDPTTIDRLVDSGRLTRYKVGGMSRFDMYEMDDMVKSGAQTTGATRAG